MQIRRYYVFDSETEQAIPQVLPALPEDSEQQQTGRRQDRLRRQKRRAGYTREALGKADALLRSVCVQLGFTVSPGEITKGPIRIERTGAAKFYLNGSSFRCLTNDYRCPPDDRVVAKVLALTSEQAMRRISTLSAGDRALIRQWVSPPTIPTLSAKERMQRGAFHTHQVRTDSSTQTIVLAIQRLTAEKRRPTKAAVARLLNMSREHLSRRYSDLFLAKKP